MSKIDNLKVITPVEVVQKNNPLIRGIVEMSEKWHKHWSDIDQPWPVVGTFNPDVIKTMKVLVSTYKTGEKAGKKGEKRKQKRQMELEMLQLFEIEGQQWSRARKEEKDRVQGEIEKNARSVEKLMVESNVPFSHLVPVQRPPPYEKEVELRELYPQLPVITQEGDYHITDDNDKIVEIGKAETTLKMYPGSKRKSKTVHFKAKDKIRVRKIDFEDDDQSDLEGAIGGYDPAVKKILARAERKGARSGDS